MKEQNTHVTYTRSELDALPDETDWERVDALTDEDIEKAALSDPDDPPTDADFWKDATVVMPENMEEYTQREIREALVNNQISDERQLFYLNNCQGRAHSCLYGENAFFDLCGKEKRMALGIRTGDKCVVAHRDPNEPTGPNGMICFRRFIFSHGEECEAEDGTMCRVFFGDCYEAEHLRKEKACLHAEYSIFFKYCVPKNRSPYWRFVRQSVITPTA